MSEVGRSPILDRILGIRRILTKEVGVYALVAAAAFAATPVAYRLNFGPLPTSKEISTECPKSLVPTTPNGLPFSGITYIACSDSIENYYNPNKVFIHKSFIFGNNEINSGNNVETYIAICDDNDRTDGVNIFAAPELNNTSLARDPNDTMGLYYKLLCEPGATPKLVPLEATS